MSNTIGTAFYASSHASILVGARLGLERGPAKAADNPLNLIEPGTISVGSMGNEYSTSPTRRGNSPASTSNVFLDVARRIGFDAKHVTFTGPEDLWR